MTHASRPAAATSAHAVPNFAPEMVEHLPDAARRWLLHAIAPGTPLRRTAVIRQHGRIRIGCWQRFDAQWALAPPASFVWRAHTRVGPVRISGSDRYVDGVGAMDWRLYGHVPLVSVSDADVGRSSAGRVAAESCFVPAAALAASWEGIDDRTAVASFSAQGYTHRVSFTVADSGALSRVDVNRWGKPTGRHFAHHLFSAELTDAEIRADGFTIPAGARAGWWRCADRCATEEFFRFVVDEVSFV